MSASRVLRPTRRDSLAFVAAAAALPSLAFAASPGEPFSWDRLKRLATDLATRPFRPTASDPAAHAIDYDTLGRVAYRADHALWRGEGAREARLFPLSRFAATPVAVALVGNGVARPVPFGLGAFDVAADAAGRRPTLAAGWSGFRLMEPGGRSDWLAFQGASYFRAAGALDQYGASARGLAVDTAIDGREEFPAFTRFWLERGPGDALTVYALLDGPSVAGAFRFVNRRTPAGIVQDVSLAVHLRRDVARLGLAPLTSMFWYGEGNRAAASDWRPEIHDSDGLALFTGAGERLWRPLTDPPAPAIDSFVDTGPRGFGLLQRDRVFDHYQDDGAFYDRRPSVWVEPQGDWGAGAVMLYEIPTRHETDDNIVAFWTPAAAARAGDAIERNYRLSWTAADPAPPGLARTADCWTGTAGPPGFPPLAGARRLVADFAGEALIALDRDSGVEAVVSATPGRIVATHVYPVVGQRARWRLIVDVAQLGDRPNDLRAYLRRGQAALTETLLYRLS